jgi:hypothetical protein
MRDATAFIAIILAGCTVPAEAQKSKPVVALPSQGRESNPDDRLALYIQTPSRLLKAYEENEIAADQLYKNERIWFYDGAYVDKIGRDLPGKPYLILRTSHDVRSVQAFFRSDSILAHLRPGDHISVTGTCAGLMSNVILENCVIHPPVWRDPDCIKAGRGCPGGISYEKEVPMVKQLDDIASDAIYQIIPAKIMSITQAEVDEAKTEPQLRAMKARLEAMLAAMHAAVATAEDTAEEDKIVARINAAVAKINAAVVAKDSVAYDAALKELKDLRHSFVEGSDLR